jgi:HSP20 family protein
MPERGEFFPAVNLKETENEYVITAEVPGLKKGELDVNVGEDNVTLKGERKEEKEEKKENYHYKEAVYGAFERVIPLPGTIKSAEAKAQLKDGVLTLTLPKAEATKKKEIKVKVD